MTKRSKPLIKLNWLKRRQKAKPDPKPTPQQQRLLIIRTFHQESIARIYLSQLQKAGIPCLLSNANTSVTIPIAGGIIGLHINEVDQTKALEIIKELDERFKDSEEDFHEADHEEIAYQKALHQPPLQSIRFIGWLLVLVIILIILRAIARANFWVPNFDSF